MGLTLRTVVASVVAVISLFTCGSSVAQVQVFPIDTKGKVISVTPKVITVQTATGNLFAEIDPIRTMPDGKTTLGGIDSPQIKVRGNADVAFIKPGMFVRFEATVEYKRRVTEELAQLTVIGQTKDIAFGFTSPAVGVDAGAEEPKKKAVKYIVAGQVKSIRRNSMVVLVPDEDKVKDVSVRLARDAKVKLAVDDIRLIRPGDDISVKGLYVTLPRFFATVVEVTRIEEPVKGAPDPAVAKSDPREQFGKEDSPDGDAPKFKGVILKVN